MVEHLLAVGANEEVEVVIAMPGDTVVLRAGDLHCVITVFPEGTPACEQLAIVNGQTWISKWDVERGLKFLARRTHTNFDEKLPLIYLKAAKKFDTTKYKFERVTTNNNEKKIQEDYFNSKKTLEELGVSAEMARRAGLKKSKKMKRAGNLRKI
jgi:hypothetical protein